MMKDCLVVFHIYLRSLAILLHIVLSFVCISQYLISHGPLHVAACSDMMFLGKAVVL